MVELIILVMLSFLAAGTAVKVYDWRQDVLYGPYLKRDDHYEVR